MAIGVVPLTAVSDAWSRTGMMTISLGAAALLGVAAAFAPNFPALLTVRVLQGSRSRAPGDGHVVPVRGGPLRLLGQAMGLYVAGNGIGGMAGRLLADGMLEVTGSWRWAIGAVGAVATVSAVLFHLTIPASVRFVRRDPSRARWPPRSGGPCRTAGCSGST
ncbi:MFS transporter [Streptomyces sp. M19]